MLSLIKWLSSSRQPNTPIIVDIPPGLISDEANPVDTQIDEFTTERVLTKGCKDIGL
jgi:hypothetical protein